MSQNYTQKLNLKTNILLALVSFIIVSLVAAVAIFTSIEKSKEEEKAEDTAVYQELPEALSFTARALSEAIEGAEEDEVAYVEKLVSAKVLPENAQNKQVDWKLEASNPDAVLDEYVTVTPEEDGSTNASIKCYQAFEFEIILTVTTREGGFTDTCLIKFVGTPTEMTLTINGEKKTGTFGDSRGQIEYSYYEVGAGEEIGMTFEVKLDNMFGQVNSSFYNALTFKLSGPEVKYTDDTYSTAEGNGYEAEIVSISNENGVVTLSVSCTIDEYERFNSYPYAEGSFCPAISVTVCLEEAGLSETFNILPIVAVEGVEIEGGDVEV